MRDGLKIPQFEPPQPIKGETFSGYWQRFMEALTKYAAEVGDLVTETNL